jgi:hypothetical protein
MISSGSRSKWDSCSNGTISNDVPLDAATEWKELSRNSLIVTVPMLLSMHGGVCAQLVNMRCLLFRSKEHLPTCHSKLKPLVVFVQPACGKAIHTEGDRFAAIVPALAGKSESNNAPVFPLNGNLPFSL